MKRMHHHHPWAICERCQASTPGPYKVLVLDPEYPTGYADLTLCQGCGKQALRLRQAERTRVAVFALPVPDKAAA